MFRRYRNIFFATLGFLAVTTTVASQAGAAVSRQKVEAGANQPANQKQRGSAYAVGARNLINRKDAVKPECGAPKECRAEQREKDDLVAQQVAAKAAADQARSSWWQTGVGAAGVVLLILTVLYTHIATKAAVNAVATLVAVERARLAMNEINCITTKDGITGKFSLGVKNMGRSTAALREVCIQGSKTGLFKDFAPVKIDKHNSGIATEHFSLAGEFEFPLGDPGFAFIVGYYKFSTIFSKRLLTDYFCMEVCEFQMPLIPGAAATAGKSHFGPSRYRTDLDWPPDEEWQA